MRPHFLPHAGLQGLIDALTERGYQVIGPQVKEGAVVLAPLAEATALPWGVRDAQLPGSYTLEEGDEQRAFEWVNGPSSLKPFLLKKQDDLWQSEPDIEDVTQFESRVVASRQAILGVRPCDLLARRVHDRVFLQGEHVDIRYQTRSDGLFTVAVNCTRSADTCFCVSQGGSTRADSGYDLCMTETDGGLVVEAGSDAGAEVLQALDLPSATSEQLRDTEAAVEQAATTQTRTTPSQERVRRVLPEAKDHPYWDQLAERCESCGNCTQFCPTCFCHKKVFLPSLDGDGGEQIREWASCHGEAHSYVSGKSLRDQRRERHRMWVTHKFANMHEQFGTSACVGCGRCISWCTNAIDVTETLSIIVGDGEPGEDLSAEATPPVAPQDAPADATPSSPCQDPYLPRTVEVVGRRTEGPKVVTLQLRYTDPDAEHSFAPGQFNMLHGADGDVPISIVAGNDRGYFEHCIRGVGNASRELAAARKGDTLGLRGPFGHRGWPLAEAEGRDVLVLSGGIGCAAVASAIEHIEDNRERYGRLFILQGVSVDADHIYDERFRRWAACPDTQVLLASMEAGPEWPGKKGLVTDLFEDMQGFRPASTTALICGPEVMVHPVVGQLLERDLRADAVHVSLERNMQCGIGHCGHCQLGPHLVCRDGPVFRWSDIVGTLASAP